jgi:hypothetical protein
MPAIAATGNYGWFCMNVTIVDDWIVCDRSLHSVMLIGWSSCGLRNFATFDRLIGH